jgi:hypothetical protein
MPRGSPIRKLEKGETFGELVIVKQANKPSNSGKIYECLCSCGEVSEVTATLLISGQTKSCGCRGKTRLQIGEKFGMLYVEAFSKTVSSSVIWLCKCDCGGYIEKSTKFLRGSKNLNCGCHPKAKKSGDSAKTHGMSGTATYRTWYNMMNRCYKENNTDYHHYGGRGITVCDRWLESFENFYEDMGTKPKGMSLERLQLDLGYSSDNCTWANETTQNYHQRKRKDNTSGVPGVSYRNNKGWLVRLYKDKALVHSSLHENKEEAIRIRKEVELEFYGYAKSK